MTITAQPSPTQGNQSDVERVRRLSATLSGVCLVLIVVLPLLVAGYWALEEASSLAVRANLDAGAIQQPLQIWQRVGGALLSEVPLALLLPGLWQARMCFAGFADGQIFTAQAVQRLRGFAGWTFAAALAAIAVDPAISVLLTITNPPDARHIAIGLSTDHIFSLLFAATVWLMAAVIGQGRALADENAAFL